MTSNKRDYTSSIYSDNQNEEFSAWLAKLPQQTDEELAKSCNQFIWLSAYAGNNPRSNYHRMVDACYDECDERGKTEIYSTEHKAVRESLS